MQKNFKFSIAPLRKLASDFFEFLGVFFSYSKTKLVRLSVVFERNKNNLIKLFTIKRGRYTRPFLHLATMGALGIGIISAPFIASTYPIFSSNNNTSTAQASARSITIGDNVFQTDISQKPRDKIITYTVQKGDTLSTIAQKFAISTDTIRWANDLTNDNITVGDSLQILPVTGIAYKVQSGDTVYSIAKTFDTDAQKIVDFPFNDFANPETFSLVIGQILIVPDGIKPSEQPYVKHEVYIAQGPSVPAAGGFTWPVHGIVTQFASWYHMALDIAAPYGSPIVAARGGTVVEVNTGTWDYGYGNNVVIDHGDGTKSLYAHMESVNVDVGQTVIGGSSVIGWIGMSGRTTGPHVHFEIRKNDTAVNPLPYLQ